MASTTPQNTGPTSTASSIPNLKDRLPKLEPRKRRNQPSNPIPVPEAPTLPSPPDSSSGNWTFKIPSRRILSRHDHDLFLSSPTELLIRSWIFTLADAVTDTPCSAVKDEDLSVPVRTLLNILDDADSYLMKCPPDEQGGSRFGNKAFRSFLDLVADNAPRWHRALGVTDPSAIAELSAYLHESFGNRSRIDYGSGHELNFLIWLLCLYQLNILHTSPTEANASSTGDLKPLVLRVFARYLALMRGVQMTYYLEPAGSHGVWGLDDYQFLPFLFGATQLLHHPYVTPRAIHQDLSLEEFGDEYMYLGQVAFVNSTKTVRGLRWHSPMLDDISSARSWTKIDGGMRRMFVAEVLGKLPVMQHFMFGSLVPAAEGMSEDYAGRADDSETRSAEEQGGDPHTGHAHDGTGWGDCCGIKVPSSIAAAQEMKKARQGETLRRIPFD
ncbi:phosphotyrosyl phosphate activator (PTPA) protein [Sarocladium implicatum]|nr:phosphotyrosyl phosphate activator (PTPA) protein [Sarocladium implicatum]